MVRIQLPFYAGVAFVVTWFFISQIFFEHSLSQIKELENRLSESSEKEAVLLIENKNLKQRIKELERINNECEDGVKKTTTGGTGTSTTGLPKSLKNLAYDYSTVSRIEMGKMLQLGVPLDTLERTPAKDALILYPTEKTLPNNYHRQQQPLNATEATENCMSVKLILQDAIAYRKQCLVIMPQYESYHIHKFMRLPMDEGKVDKSLPLRHVSRSHNEDGGYPGTPGLNIHIEPFRKTLIEYYERIDHIIGKIKPLLEAFHSKTIIVLVCNFGQSQLLRNFVCNARSKGLDLKQVFLFATDEKTYNLAKSLDITAFYDEVIFGGIPEQAAGYYGDQVFGKIMMAKVYCGKFFFLVGACVCSRQKKDCFLFFCACLEVEIKNSC